MSVIPWKVRNLGTLVTFLDNLRRPITAADRIGGPVPYYGANGVQDHVQGHIFNEPLLLLAEDGGNFNEPEKGVAYRIDGPSWVNNHAHVLRPNPDVDLGYLCRYLEHRDLREFVSGSTRGKLTKSSALRIPIPVPPLPEQRRIAAILDAAEVLRVKRRTSVDLLAEVEDSLFDELFGSVIEAHDNERFAPLRDLTTKVGSGATPRGGKAAYLGGEFSLIRSMNVRDNHFLSKDLARINDKQANLLQSVNVEADDVLLNITGASVARVCQAPPEVLPARVNQHVCIIRPNSALLPTFLARQLTTPRMKTKLLGIGAGGATREAITKQQVLDLEVFVPEMSDQLEFVKLLSMVSRARQLARQHELRASELMTALQSSLFGAYNHPAQPQLRQP